MQAELRVVLPLLYPRGLRYMSIIKSITVGCYEMVIQHAI
jgi:hypothetical protein